MNKTAQILSVGGSPTPIITSVKQLKPDYVVFFCSERSQKYVDAPGKPCEISDGENNITKQPSLVAQLGLTPEQYEKVSADVDDLGEAYEALSAVIDRLCNAGYECIADYTGGSKTMSAALAMAAVDHGQKLYLTSGLRTDTVKVHHGESTAGVSTQPIQLQRVIRGKLQSHLSQYDYPAALTLLKDTLAQNLVGREQKTLFRTLVNYVSALDCWDRFDHKEALVNLSVLQRYASVRTLTGFLRSIAHSRKALDKGFEISDSDLREGHGFEVLEDLLLNALRRAEQQRYDDAVGRLYRSLELFGQLRLHHEYGIQSSAVREEQVPEEFAESCPFKDGVAKIGLFKCYELLACFPDDPLGTLFKERAGQLRNALSARNESLLAHGFQPVGETDWRNFKGESFTFIEDGLKRLLSKEYRLRDQLPCSIPQDLIPSNTG